MKRLGQHKPVYGIGDFLGVLGNFLHSKSTKKIAFVTDADAVV